MPFEGACRARRLWVPAGGRPAAEEDIGIVVVLVGCWGCVSRLLGELCDPLLQPSGDSYVGITRAAQVFK